MAWVTLTGFGPFPGLDTFDVGDSVNFVHSLLLEFSFEAFPSTTDVTVAGSDGEFDPERLIVDITFLFKPERSD